MALRKVEYMVGDSRGAGVVTFGKNGFKRPSFLSNKLGRISNPLGEGPDPRTCLDRLRCRIAFRLLQDSKRAVQSSSSRASRSGDSSRVFRIANPCR
jgi:hypothetical protein